jgi:sugar lactone lactonase YvrE
MIGMGPVLGQVRLVWAAGAELGESALWDDRAGRLWWVDIKGCCLHRMDEAGSDRRSWDLPQEPGCLALTEDAAGIITGLRTGVFSFQPETGQLEFLAAPEGHSTRHRLNDGKVDPSGRFWFGTMHIDEHPAEGALHILDGPERVARFGGPYTVPNGPAFSPDGHVMYCADSPTRIIYSFDLRREAPEKRMFVRFGDDDGYPDGMAVDAEGCLWVAIGVAAASPASPLMGGPWSGSRCRRRTSRVAPSAAPTCAHCSSPQLASRAALGRGLRAVSSQPGPRSADCPRGGHDWRDRPRAGCLTLPLLSLTCDKPRLPQVRRGLPQSRITARLQA